MALRTWLNAVSVITLSLAVAPPILAEGVKVSGRVFGSVLEEKGGKPVKKPAAGAAVHLRDLPRGWDAGPSAEPVTLRLVKGRLVPDFACLQVGQKLVVKAAKGETFDLHAHSRERAEYGQIIPSNPRVFSDSFPRPDDFVSLACALNPGAQAHLQVVPTPGFTLCDAEGRFTLPRRLPAGRHVLKGFLPGMGWGEKAITLRGGEGEVRVDIELALRRKDRPAAGPIDIGYAEGEDTRSHNDQWIVGTWRSTRLKHTFGEWEGARQIELVADSPDEIGLFLISKDGKRRRAGDTEPSILRPKTLFFGPIGSGLLFRYQRRGNKLILVAPYTGIYAELEKVQPAQKEADSREDTRRQSRAKAAVEKCRAALVVVRAPQREGKKKGDARPALGILLDAGGTVVTSHSLIKGMEKLEVVLGDGRRLPARAVRSDPDLDLAMVRVEDSKPLPHARVGDSDKVMVGDSVLALSAPWRIATEELPTVTCGIIAGKGRKKKGEELFAVDTAIGPGCGPGPLVNTEGEFIGLVVGRELAPRGTNGAGPSKRILERLTEWRKEK